MDKARPRRSIRPTSPPRLLRKVDPAGTRAAAAARHPTLLEDASAAISSALSAANSGQDAAATPLAGNRAPPYPWIARIRGHEGRVVLRVQVETDGSVGEMHVIRGSGRRSLDQAALKAVRDWRFEPALRAGKRITSSVHVPVLFRLDDQR